MTTYNNVLDVFSYAAHTLANTLWSERALTYFVQYIYRLSVGDTICELMRYFYYVRE